MYSYKGFNPINIIKNKSQSSFRLYLVVVVASEHFLRRLVRTQTQDHAVIAFVLATDECRF